MIHMRITVGRRVYDTHGVDNSFVKNFDRLEEALRYLFDLLDGEKAEIALC